MAKIIICAPPQTERSDGVRALYLLCGSLRQIGVDADILLLDGRDKTFRSFALVDGAERDAGDPAAPRYLGTTDKIDFENDIFVYPEIVPDNPLNARHVVRYFLNKEGNLTGVPIAIGANDFLISFQKIFRPDAAFNLYYPMVDLTPGDAIEVALNRPRPFSTTFFGKGTKYGTCVRVPGTLGLDFQKAYDEYQLLLRSSEYVFTYDFMTGVCADAVVHGALPVVMSTTPWTAEELESVEIKIPHITYQEYLERRNDSTVLAEFFVGRQRMIDDIQAMKRGFPERIAQLVHAFENAFGIRCARLQHSI